MSSVEVEMLESFDEYVPDDEVIAISVDVSEDGCYGRPD